MHILLEHFFLSRKKEENLHCAQKTTHCRCSKKKKKKKKERKKEKKERKKKKNNNKERKSK